MVAAHGVTGAQHRAMTATTILTRAPVPRDRQRDYTEEMAAAAGRSPTERTGSTLQHVGHYSFDPATLPGNIENFIGVAQVPIGLAGPLRINGEHAQGEFFVPLATTEGTLVASYNRGMRLLTESGGVRTTVVDESMQRAPVFVFDNALEARTVRRLGRRAPRRDPRAAPSRRPASASSIDIGQYGDRPAALPALQLHHRRRRRPEHGRQGDVRRLRVDPAAVPGPPRVHPLGQHRHRQEALADQHDRHPRQAGRRRGRRSRRDAAEEPDGRRHRDAVLARQISNVGAFLVGADNNGAHSANGLTAMFIATGQDVANVSESHAGIVYTELLPNGDYYWSITLPSLIVATYGGGTGLATQRECLEMLGCYGKGKVKQVRRDLRRRRAGRRDLAVQRRSRRRLGVEPRAVRPQPALTPSAMTRSTIPPRPPRTFRLTTHRFEPNP